MICLMSNSQIERHCTICFCVKVLATVEKYKYFVIKTIQIRFTRKHAVSCKS